MAQLFTDDGVFLQLFRPTHVGKEEIRRAYDTLFKQEKMSLTFQIDEVVQVAPDWAFARATTGGPFTVIATGAQVNDPTQVLIILRRDVDRGWRIARFAFSPTVFAKR